MANLTLYLDENYPVSNRSSVTNLDLSNKNFVGNLTISGFVNLQKLNYSINNFNGSISLRDCGNLEDLDGSFINAWGSHWYSMAKLKKLKLSNNRLTAVDISGSANLAYLEFNSNLLTELDLSNSENYVEVNCSNNPTLSKIYLPDNFVPVLFDCRDTTLGQVTFSNSSVFDCQKNIIVSAASTSTKIPSPTKSTSTKITSTFTNSKSTPIINDGSSTTKNNLGLKIGLSVGIIAMFLLGIVAFLCYRRRIRKKETSTPVLQIADSRNLDR
ncbi:hypothetical protein Glove_680g21 [Diversispora epigaea]|uniref:Uncharacterized protein n=1 Tax=Diversispora epigaea TaxID=1348612 RepID=A0A397G701_9GLOM|nr:hypothetical protein Glove_680g21 [Diversispora epigaea]